MLVLIGWRSRAEIASASHDAHAAIRRARVPWPAPVRIGLILAGAVFACWLPYQLSTFDVALYDRMGLYALVTIGLTLLMGYAGQISLGQGGLLPHRRLHVGDPDGRASTPTPASSIPRLASRRSSQCSRRPSWPQRSPRVIGVPLLRLHGHYLAFATLALHLIAFSVLSAWDRFTGGQYGDHGHEAAHRIRARAARPAARSRRLGGRCDRLAAGDESRPFARRARPAGDRDRRGLRRGFGHPGRAATSSGCSSSPPRSPGSAVASSRSAFLIVSPEAFPIVLSIAVRRHGRRRRARQHLRRRGRDGGHPLPRAEAP